MSLYDRAQTTIALNTAATPVEINMAAFAQAFWAEREIGRLEDDVRLDESVKHSEIRGAARYRDASISILAIGTGIPFQSWLDTIRAVVLEERTS